MRLLVAVLLLAVVVGAAYACEAYVICPYDGAYAYSAGYVYCQNGAIVCKYHCQRGHWLQEACN